MRLRETWQISSHNATKNWNEIAAKIIRWMKFAMWLAERGQHHPLIPIGNLQYCLLLAKWQPIWQMYQVRPPSNVKMSTWSIIGTLLQLISGLCKIQNWFFPPTFPLSETAPLSLLIKPCSSTIFHGNSLDLSLLILMLHLVFHNYFWSVWCFFRMFCSIWTKYNRVAFLFATSK